MSILASCQEDLLKIEEVHNKLESSIYKEDDMQRIKLSSTEELKNLISQMDPDGLSTRTLVDVEYSNGDKEFISLIEANRLEVMSSLTKEQLDSLERDEDELEFCPTDSIIADIQFAQLLNANRTIQVGEYVYMYLNNGVLITDEKNAPKLKDVAPIAKRIPATPENQGSMIKVAPDMNLYLMVYDLKTFDDNSWGGGGGSGTGPNEPGENKSNAQPIYLSNGVVIPGSDIREWEYYQKGDGNWVHQVVTGIFGRNIVARCKFNNHKQLNLNFYDQNYLIYANIGTKLKMQKKVCGIWWNIKAEEMEHGWETVSIKYSVPAPIHPSTFTHPDMPGATATVEHPFPFSNENIVLFHIPFIDYDFTSKDVNKAFKKAAEKAYNAASAWAKKKVGSPDNMGLTCTDGKDVYIVYGPYRINAKNRRSLESKFYSKWFSGEVMFTFSIENSIKLKNIKFSLNDGVELYRGSVFGAIKYKGRWLGARLYKNQ